MSMQLPKVYKGLCIVFSKHKDTLFTHTDKNTNTSKTRNTSQGQDFNPAPQIELCAIYFLCSYAHFLLFNLIVNLVLAL